MPKSIRCNLYDLIQYWTIDTVGIPICCKLGLSPNAVTMIGFLPILYQYLAIVSCDRLGIHVFAAMNYWFDCLDGELARKTGQVSYHGGLFDTVHDSVTGLILLYFVDYRLAIFSVIAIWILVQYVFEMSWSEHTPRRFHTFFYLIHDNMIIGYLLINEVINYSQC